MNAYCLPPIFKAPHIHDIRYFDLQISGNFQLCALGLMSMKIHNLTENILK